VDCSRQSRGTGNNKWKGCGGEGISVQSQISHDPSGKGAGNPEQHIAKSSERRPMRKPMNDQSKQCPSNNRDQFTQHK
jgi:hypothetical protein